MNGKAHGLLTISLLTEVSHDETNWNERRETSAGFQRVSYHACPHISLTTSDVFVTYDTTQKTGLNLSANSANANGCWIWARIQMLNGQISWRWNDLASGRCRPLQVYEESQRGEFEVKFFVLYEPFDRRSTRIWSEIYWALWNCWFYCHSVLFFLRRKRFVEWCLASDGWSGFPANNICQATISAFWFVKSMSINPKSVQKSEIECKKVKLSGKNWNWVQNGEIKMIDSSYFELRQTKWRTKIEQRLKLFIEISIQLPHNKAKCKAQQQ